VRLRQIRDFISVVESGSIRGAAKALKVSQPALTKSVRSLEAELESQLLQRSPQGVVPTTAGRTFFTRAKAAQSELRKAREELLELKGGEEGAVAFGAGPLVTSLIVPDAVAAFRARHARTRIHIVEGFTRELLPLVRDETLDFAVGPRFQARLDAVFRFRPLFRNTLAIVARKGHPLRDVESVTDLAKAEWISIFPSGPQSPVAAAFSAAHVAAPEQLIRCDSFNVALNLMVRTDAVGIMSRLLLTKTGLRERLQEIRVREPMPEFTVGLFTRADSPLSRRAGAMAKEIVTAARALAGGT
jgi:DNA-binding transcriptional LysR family regulator